MAKKIQAINAYCPRIDLADAADEDRYMELVTQRTTLSSGVVKNVQEASIEALIGLLLEGRPVHTGFAIYTPSIGLDGTLDVKVKLNKRVLSALNADGAFRGKIVNVQNAGKTSDELVTLWNEAHPDDPVT